jgi:prolyl oligopeptidase
MRPIGYVLSALLLTACTTTKPVEAPEAAITYPETKVMPKTDDFFGETVADPYRWLEDDVRESIDVKAWVEAQNNVTNAFLAGLPGREAIKARITELYDYERFGLPSEEGGRYFFTRNSGLQNQSPLYVADGFDGEPRLLIDPNAWSEDGTVALAGGNPSPDGKKYAYFIQDAGSDWRVVEVLDVDTGDKRADRLEWLKSGGISWARDSSGFYYSRFPAPKEGEAFQSVNINQKVYFHKLGDPQAMDRLVLEDPANPEINHIVEETEDGRYLVVYGWKGTDGNSLGLRDLRTRRAPVTVVDGFANNTTVLGNVGDVFYALTDLGAPTKRIVAFSYNDAAPSAWRDVIPAAPESIESASLIGGRLVVQYLKDAKSLVRVITLEGAEERIVALPGIGSAFGFGGKADNSETFFGFTSYNRPTTLYRYDVVTGEQSVWKAPALKFNPDEFEVSQRFFESSDGARVPMFIVRKKGVTPTRPRPTMLYGYGGFNVSLTPGFGPADLVWMEMGGVYVEANVRGGGEYGRDWHDAGRRANKQNVFDDFIAAAEALIEDSWASAETIAIRGGSNGGLLVGAVLNQRPDLFAAANPAVGVMDMLRFHKFTAGRYWVDDYGDPEVEADYRILRAYSPYHNIKHGVSYPPVLVTTADTDDRVVPGHSFKYAAALQAAEIGDAPHLIRIETRAGHGAGKPTTKIIEELADVWAFFARYTGITLKDDKR